MYFADMNPRNMSGNNRMIEYEGAQQMQNQQHREPYILLGSTPSFPQSNAHQILPPSGSISSFDPHRLPEHQNGTSLYRQPQYAHQVHPVANPELGIPTPSAFYNPFLSSASGARMFPPSVNHNSMEQLPSSSNFVPTAARVSGYGVNSFPPNVVRGSSKRNGTEVFMGNNQYYNAPAAPSTMAMPPMNAGHFDSGVAVLDACFPLPDYRGNYMGQSFRPPNSTWCDRQPNVVADSNTLSFNGPPISPYYEVSNITGGSSDMGNIGGQRFHEGASTSRGSQNLMHYTPMLHPLHEFHPSQGIPSRYNVNYRPPAATSSSRHPVNNNLQYVSSISRPQQGLEAVPPPPGIRIFRSQRRSVTPEGMHRHPDLPRLRYLEEGVAILEFPGHYETGSAVDHHRDMRLDIDYMSYEELLALSERIGNVKTGLSEDTVTAHLKTRVHMTTIDLEELPCGSDEKNDSCVICQAEYEVNDKIGSLECGHEYHVGCLKKWLPVKNTCPICKSTALSVEPKKSGQLQ